MRKPYTRRIIGRQYYVKTYGGDPERNALIVKLKKQGKKYMKIRHELIRLGYDPITPQRVSQIYRAEISPLT